MHREMRFFFPSGIFPLKSQSSVFLLRCNGSPVNTSSVFPPPSSEHAPHQPPPSRRSIRSAQLAQLMGLDLRLLPSIPQSPSLPPYPHSHQHPAPTPYIPPPMSLPTSSLTPQRLGHQQPIRCSSDTHRTHKLSSDRPTEGDSSQKGSMGHVHTNAYKLKKMTFHW